MDRKYRLFDILIIFCAGLLVGLWVSGGRKTVVIHQKETLLNDIRKIETDTQYLKGVPADSIYNNIIRYIESSADK